MTSHTITTYLLALDLVLIKLVDQVTRAGLGHMDTEKQQEEDQAQQGDSGHSLGLTHPE